MRAGTQTRAHTHTHRGKGKTDYSFAGEGVTKRAVSGPFCTFCHHVVTKRVVVTKPAATHADWQTCPGPAGTLWCESNQEPGGHPVWPDSLTVHGATGHYLSKIWRPSSVTRLAHCAWSYRPLLEQDLEAIQCDPTRSLCMELQAITWARSGGHPVWPDSLTVHGATGHYLSKIWTRLAHCAWSYRPLLEQDLEAIQCDPTRSLCMELQAITWARSGGHPVWPDSLTVHGATGHYFKIWQTNKLFPTTSLLSNIQASVAEYVRPPDHGILPVHHVLFHHCFAL